MFALVDCNSFYASCERLFKPHLINKPVVVLSNNDGCIIALSKEAKQIGIVMGQPYFKAKHLIKQHNVAVFSSNYQLYGDISARVMQTLQQFTPAMEVYSIDEAFLDVSSMSGLQEYGNTIASTIHKWVGVPVTVGIARTKTLAKVASYLTKKNPKYATTGKCFYLDPAMERKALEQTPIGEVWGIGRRNAQKLELQGVHNALQFVQQSDGWVRKLLTIQGLKTKHELLGISCISLEQAPPTKKSITVSRSFGNVINSKTALQEAIANFAVRGAEKLRGQDLYAHTLMVYARTNPFDNKAKQQNISILCELPYYTNHSAEIVTHAKNAIASIYKENVQYKKAGIYLMNLTDTPQSQTSLFDKPTHDVESQQALMTVIDTTNKRYGKNAVFLAAQGVNIRMSNQKWRGHSKSLSPCYTTNWNDIMQVQN